jgi:acyl-CoA dehydrogenase
VDELLDRDQQDVVSLAQQVGNRFGLDYWAAKDRVGEYPAEAWTAICHSGLGGISLPVEYGGGGQGMLHLALVVEELSACGAGATVGQLFMLNPIFGGLSISKFGSESMKQQLLPPLCAGELTCCMALTEADAGTNTLAMRTTARPVDGGWQLTGSKLWITGVPEADKMLVVARTRPRDTVARSYDGISLFLVDRDRPGISYSPIEKLGTNTLSLSSISFDDVKIASGELIGTLDAGWPQLLDVLNTERIVTAAALVGAGRLALRLAVEYAAKRTVFGSTPIGAYQGIQFPLAQAYAELQCARAMNLRAATLYDRGLSYGAESNIAKLIAFQACEAAIDRTMQTLGGMGYARDNHVERLWRDTRLFKFAPVSQEMVLNYLGIHCLGMPRSY